MFTIRAGKQSLTKEKLPLCMSMGKKEENRLRLRYVRSLERFLSSIVSYLSKSQNLTKEKFDKKVANNSKVLERTQKVPLYKEDFKKLESLVKKVCRLPQTQTPIEEIKKEILYEANRLEKSKNFKKYKKPKHTKKNFGEWE